MFSAIFRYLVDVHPPYHWAIEACRRIFSSSVLLEQQKGSCNLNKELLLREQRDTETISHDTPALLQLHLCLLIDDTLSVALAYILYIFPYIIDY